MHYRRALLPLKPELKYVYGFSIILQQLTISFKNSTTIEFSYNKILDFLWLELLFCRRKCVKTSLCCGAVFLAKIHVYVNRYFVGLTANLKTNMLPYEITASETGG